MKKEYILKMLFLLCAFSVQSGHAMFDENQDKKSSEQKKSSQGEYKEETNEENNTSQLDESKKEEFERLAKSAEKKMKELNLVETEYIAAVKDMFKYDLSDAKRIGKIMFLNDNIEEKIFAEIKGKEKYSSFIYNNLEKYLKDCKGKIRRLCSEELEKEEESGQLSARRRYQEIEEELKTRDTILSNFRKMISESSVFEEEFVKVYRDKCRQRSKCVNKDDMKKTYAIFLYPMFSYGIESGTLLPFRFEVLGKTVADCLDLGEVFSWKPREAVPSSLKVTWMLFCIERMRNFVL